VAKDGAHIGRRHRVDDVEAEAEAPLALAQVLAAGAGLIALPIGGDHRHAGSAGRKRATQVHHLEVHRHGLEGIREMPKSHLCAERPSCRVRFRYL
jgi:hypothetical protein